VQVQSRILWVKFSSRTTPCAILTFDVVPSRNQRMLVADFPPCFFVSWRKARSEDTPIFGFKMWSDHTYSADVAELSIAERYHAWLESAMFRKIPYSAAPSFHSDFGSGSDCRDGDD